MHPEVSQDGPGNCPQCGMALEATNAVHAAEDPELRNMTRRFLFSLFFTLPLFVLAMSHDFFPEVIGGLMSGSVLQKVQFLLATPVVLWAGWPFFQRGWASIVNRSFNMFTLIAIGVGVAWTYSTFATFFPDLFPPSVRMADGVVDSDTPVVATAKEQA